jgi:hypothetical protein
MRELFTGLSTACSPSHKVRIGKYSRGIPLDNFITSTLQYVVFIQQCS